MWTFCYLILIVNLFIKINGNQLDILDLLSGNQEKYENAVLSYQKFNLKNEFACEFIFRLNITEPPSQISDQLSTINKQFYTKNLNFINWVFLLRSETQMFGVRARKYRNSIEFIYNGNIATFYNLNMFDGNWHKIIFYYMNGSVRMGIDCANYEVLKFLTKSEQVLWIPEYNVKQDDTLKYVIILGDHSLPIEQDIEFDKMKVFDKLSDLQEVSCDDLKKHKNVFDFGNLDVRNTPDDLEAVESMEILNKRPKSDCMLSKTLVTGHQVCQGQLIFEDQFDKLSTTKWEKEIRIPLDSDNAEFVSYQDHPANCFIQSGNLNIVPTLLTDLPEFNDDAIRMGHLNLGPMCTPLRDAENECQRQARNYYILPPVVSTKIRTKSSFSFRYGRVEVRAKLPKGDWIFPQIYLEPLTNDYGVGGFKSGQIRIAFTRSNEILVNKKMTKIDGSRVYGGVILGTGEHLRHLRTHVHSKHLNDDFHVYSLTWTNDSIAMSIDGYEYGKFMGGFSQIDQISHAYLWQKGSFMAPFDREFYISLGVSAGGIADFPDGCKNGPHLAPKPWSNFNPKAELNFWQDHPNWNETWNGIHNKLTIDYIKVWAL